MVLLNNKLQDKILQEELQQRTLKIERLFHYGLQHSSNIIVPEESSGENSLSLSLDPQEIEVEAREAEAVFQETLSNVMEQKQLPQFLFQLLQQRQSETSAILGHYDDIIQMMKKHMNDQDKEYRNRIEKQSGLRELLQTRTESFISELMRVGNEEIAAAREAIILHTNKSSTGIYSKTQQFLDDTSADQPFDPHSWKAPSDILTFNSLKDVFSRSQEDIFQLRGKSLSEICDQQKELEKEKLDYALERENLDRELFNMKRAYKSEMPVLANVKREIVKSADRKQMLTSELKRINREIVEVEKVLQKIAQSSLMKKDEMDRIKQNRKNKLWSAERRVLQIKREEVDDLLHEILKIYKWFWEHICDRPLNSANLVPTGDTVEADGQIHDGVKWENALSQVPHNALLMELFEGMECYRKLMLERQELSSIKRGLCSQNSKLQVSLKCYYAYKNSS